jgi:hypothetical protein
MAILLIALRVVHIFSAFLWFGMGAFQVGFVIPTAKASGPEGQRFMQTMRRVTPINTAMGTAGGLTLLTGLVLYGLASNGFQGGWITSPYGVSITIGAIFAIAASIHGGAKLGRLSQRAEVLGQEMAAGGSPRPEQIAEMQTIQEELERGGVLSVVLLSVALFFMSVAQAVPLLFAG